MWAISILAIPIFLSLLSVFGKKKVVVWQRGKVVKVEKIRLYLNRNEAWLYANLNIKEPVSKISVKVYVDGVLIDSKSYNYVLNKGYQTLSLLLTNKLPPLEHDVRIDVYFNGNLEIILLWRYYYPPEAEELPEEIEPIPEYHDKIAKILKRAEERVLESIKKSIRFPMPTIIRYAI